MGRREEKLQTLTLSPLLGGSLFEWALGRSLKKGGFHQGRFGGCSLDPQNRNEVQETE